jgi:hypothetical protein
MRGEVASKSTSWRDENGELTLHDTNCGKKEKKKKKRWYVEKVRGSFYLALVS